MSAQIITLPKRLPAPPADPAMKRLYWTAVAWMKAERAGKPKETAARQAYDQPTPGEAEILKLLRRIDRRLTGALPPKPDARKNQAR